MPVKGLTLGGLGQLRLKGPVQRASEKQHIASRQSKIVPKHASNLLQQLARDAFVPLRGSHRASPDPMNQRPSELWISRLWVT